MRSVSSAAMKKTVTRAAFFRWGIDGIKRFTGELISSTLDQLTVEDRVSGWRRLADESAVGTKPRLYFIKGAPFFVMKEEEKGFTVFSGVCPEEGGLLEWRDSLGSFYCPFCQAKYDREGKSHQSLDIALVRHEIQVVDGHLMVNI